MRGAVFFLTFVVVFGFSDLAQADLIDRGGGLIYDTDLNITWMQDANYANSPNGMTWEAAKAWVEQLDYAGYDDWRLPAIEPIDGISYKFVPESYGVDGLTDDSYNVTSPNSELAYLFYVELNNPGRKDTDGNNLPSPGLINTGTFINVQPAPYWSGNEYLSGSGSAWNFHFEEGLQNPRGSYYFAWAVRDGDSTPIPGNLLPKAEAGPDQVVLNQVTLNGSGSSDSDGTIELYQWSLQRRADPPEIPIPAEGVDPTISDLTPGFYDVTLTITDNDEATATDTMLLAIAGFPPDTTPPTGAVHAYPSLIWPPNDRVVTVSLDGYVKDELSIARDGGEVGVSSAYLLINGNTNVPLNLDAQGHFSVTVEINAGRGAVYNVELHATDTNPLESGGSNSGLVDSTFISVER